jgi:CelD/BcsL family acetyltransferase involved in cellulose biosynthesis
MDIRLCPFSERARFRALFDSPGSAEGSLGWFDSVAANTLDPGEEAIMAVAVQQGQPRAALPLARKGGAVRALTAPYTTVYEPALPEPGCAWALGAGAARYVAGTLRLDAIDPANKGIGAFLEGLRTSELVAAQYRHFINRYERVAAFDEYWSARPSRLRATSRRKLAQAGDKAEFRCCRDNLDEAVAIYEEIYRASWKAAEPHPRFIGDMVEALAPSSFVRIGIMTLAGRPAAAQIWLVCGRRATIFKLAHRQEYADQSPGTLLTRWMISELMREDALEEIDFGRGDDTYKRDWLNNARPRIGVVAARWTSSSGCRTIAREVLPTRLSSLVHRAMDACGRFR